MPFLFVDYDQGAGGEYFCAEISKAPQCNPLSYTEYSTGRVKVNDVFNQEFLKPNPNISPPIPISNLYHVVPTHRLTIVATGLIPNIRSLRIAIKDIETYNFVKSNQLKKVLMTNEPTPAYYIGLIKILRETAIDPSFVTKINYRMRTVDLILLSKGIQPTEKAVNKYIQELYEIDRDEPTFQYDLTIDYRDLMYNHKIVKHSIKDVFGIEITSEWLNRYADNP
jgi:hypothetical protein